MTKYEKIRNYFESVLDLYINNYLTESEKDELIYGLDQDVMTESVMKTTNDILYNKKAFETGKTNVCCVTGFSGSGKSTLSNGIKAQVIDMDKIIMYHDRDDSFFKNEPPVVKAFISGPGKKYRITVEERQKIGTTKFDKMIIADLLSFVKQYASSHKKERFVLDGVWLFLFVEPSELKDFAVYIKGTSAFTSASRASKRGSNGNQAKSKLDKFAYTMKAFGRVTSTALGGKLQKYQSYFGPLYKKQLEEENGNVKEEVTDNKEEQQNKIKKIMDKIHK